MNQKQIESYKDGINKAIKVHKAELYISSESNSSKQHSANINGIIKGLELALSLFSDVLDNG